MAPGPILTHHLEAAAEQAQRQAGLSTPMGRVGQANEVAAAVLWLCSDQVAYVTGITVPIDAGQSARHSRGRCTARVSPWRPPGPDPLRPGDAERAAGSAADGAV